MSAMDQEGRKDDGLWAEMRRIAGGMRIPGRRNRLRKPWKIQWRRLCGGLNIDPLRDLSQDLIGVGFFLFNG